MSTKATVTYRDRTRNPEVFSDVDLHEGQAVVSLRHSGSYGNVQTVRIPWDLIERIETENS